MRVEIYVRPNASAPDVGGAFDGVLAVRVTEPATDGRATDAALAAVAAAIGLPRRSVTLVRGARSRRKLLEIEVGPGEGARAARALTHLRDGPG